MRHLCQVKQCIYVATQTIEVDAFHGPVRFLVCDLHDAWQVKDIFARFETPVAYMAHEVPIVLPGGPLVAEAPREAPEWAIPALEDPLLDDVPDGPHMLLDRFDLTVGR